MMSHDFQKTRIPCQYDEDCKVAMNGTIVSDFATSAEQMWATVACDGKVKHCKCRQHHAISTDDFSLCTRISTCEYLQKTETNKSLDQN